VASIALTRPASLGRTALVGLALGGLLLLSILLNLRFGAVPISSADLLAAVGLGEGDPGHVMILREIRLPRLLSALAVGATLSLAGAALQALFRNPLAEPGLLGVSTGAAMGASIWFVFGTAFLAPLAAIAWLQPFLLPGLAFVGALVSILLVLSLGRRGGAGATVLMLLVGIGVNAIGAAIIGLATFMGTDTEMRALSIWLLGSFAQVGWGVLAPALLLMALASAGLMSTARLLDLLALGEAEARHLGVDTNRLRRRLGLLTAVAVGAAVSISGIIGFVGLVVPHMVRLAVGPAHRALMPLAALGGALALSAADFVGRLIALPAEVPVGIVTALIGAPLFIAMLLRNVRRLA
jgi:iron complex transport system permease protein